MTFSVYLMLKQKVLKFLKIRSCCCSQNPPVASHLTSNQIPNLSSLSCSHTDLLSLPWAKNEARSFLSLSHAVPYAWNTIFQNLYLAFFLLTFSSLPFLKSKSSSSVTLFRTLHFFSVILISEVIYLFHDLVSPNFGLPSLECNIHSCSNFECLAICCILSD